MKAKWFAPSLLMAAVCGCTDDMEHLKAIGAKLANRTPQAENLGKMPWSDTARQLHSAISRAPLVHRVSYRLLFDKDLAEEKVSTELKGPGQIELTGFVSSENHRERAGEIASRTLGVEEVVNNLKVGKPESAPMGENTKGESTLPETSGKDPAPKPDQGSPHLGTQPTEKGNIPSDSKPTPQPGANPMPVPSNGNPVGNLGTNSVIPSSESRPTRPIAPTGPQPTTGSPVTIPPAPDKK
jgi:hypothetical protein